MKILVVGNGHSAIHEVAVVSAFRKMGHIVGQFYWRNYFHSSRSTVQLLLRVQDKFLFGPALKKLNNDLVKMALEFSPDLIFIYRGTHIKPSSLCELKRAMPGCEIFGYNNDDPFGSGHPPWLWGNFKKCLPFYDLIFAYRRHNIAEFIQFGAKRVELLMPWFIPEKDRPLAYGEVIETKFDAIFVGHYEQDLRIEYLEKIAKSNLKFGLFGPDWHRAPRYEWLQNYQPVLPVIGEFYRETLMSSKIALCFLSNLNRDSYTRRCFEIPAMGVFMLCQYSSDLVQLFEDGVDAVFFHSADDLIAKIRYYAHHDQLREKIAANGMARVMRDKHDVVSRMQYVLDQMKNKDL